LTLYQHEDIETIFNNSDFYKLSNKYIK